MLPQKARARMFPGLIFCADNSRKSGNFTNIEQTAVHLLYGGCSLSKNSFSGVSTPVTAPTPTPPPTGEGLYFGDFAVQPVPSASLRSASPHPVGSHPNPFCGAIAPRLILVFLTDRKDGLRRPFLRYSAKSLHLSGNAHACILNRTCHQTCNGICAGFAEMCSIR